MNCRRARSLLPLHVGGDLDPEAAARVDSHLAGCAECGRELRGYRAARRALLEAGPVRDLPGAAMPAPLWDRLAPRLAAADAAWKLRIPWYRRTPYVVAAAASLLVTVALAWYAVAAGETGVAAPPPPLAAQAEDSPALPSPGSLHPASPKELRSLMANFLVRKPQLSGADPAGGPVVQAGNRTEPF